MTTTVKLVIPESRIGCASWIENQSPDCVADALDITEACYNALQREVSQCEISQLGEEIVSLRRRVIEQENETFDAVRRAVAEARASWATTHEEELSRLQAEAATLRSQVQHREIELTEATRQAVIAARTSLTALHQQELSQLAEESASLRLRLQQQDNAMLEGIKSAVLAERSSLQSRHMDELGDLRNAHHIAEESLNQRLQSALNELSQRDTADRLEIAELKTQAQDQLMLERRESQHKLEQQRLDYERRFQEKETAANANTEWLKAQLDKVTSEKDRALIEYTTATARMMEEQKDFMHSLRGTSASIGRIGENLVEQIVSQMNLGTWEDTHTSQADGTADGVWEWDGSASSGKLCAMVETKNVHCLNSKKDIGKFWENVNCGVRQDRINAAVLISLRARIPNTRQFDISMYQGIPILQASRGPEDALPASTLIEVAFTTLAAAWPLINRSHHVDDKDAILETVSKQYETQLEELEKLSKRIDAVDRSGIALQREAAGLRKIRDTIVGSVNQVRLQFPCLVPEPLVELPVYVTSSEDPLDSEQGQALVSHMMTYYQSKQRYPTTLAVLNKDNTISEECLELVRCMPTVFQAAKDRAKALRTRKRARVEEAEEPGSTPQSAAQASDDALT